MDWFSIQLSTHGEPRCGIVTHGPRSMEDNGEVNRGMGLVPMARDPRAVVGIWCAYCVGSHTTFIPFVVFSFVMNRGVGLCPTARDSRCTDALRVSQ